LASVAELVQRPSAAAALEAEPIVDRKPETAVSAPAEAKARKRKAAE
jgi:hypothetical protein